MSDEVIGNSGTMHAFKQALDVSATAGAWQGSVIPLSFPGNTPKSAQVEYTQDGKTWRGTVYLVEDEQEEAE